MPSSENPYQSPKTYSAVPPKKRADWISFTRLNIAVATTLPILLLLAYLWGNHQIDQMSQQQLPRRFATYDHEYHTNLTGPIILLGLIFATPNLLLLALKFSQRK